MTSNSGLSNVTLAEIWEHSDTNKNGYLNADEFVTASHLIRLAKAGRPPPSSSSRSYRTSSLSLPMSTLKSKQLIKNEEKHQQKRNEPLTLLRSTEMSFEEIEKQIKNLSEAEKELKKEIANRESELEHLLLEVRDLEKEETEVQSRWREVDLEYKHHISRLAELETEKKEYERLLLDVRSKIESETAAVNQLKKELLNYSTKTQKKEDELQRCKIHLQELDRRQSQLAYQIEVNYKELDQLNNQI
ncbi:intersectin-2-like, partial [Zophobas morio]|uniref:intersectin-2-like n=1 Tax=Zophobas morio TaxID=2755281 RepID=UPI0030833830